MEFLRNRARFVRKLSHAVLWVEEVVRTVGMRRAELPDGTDACRWLKDNSEGVSLGRFNLTGDMVLR